MGLNPKKVYAPTPVQDKTTGAVACADVDTQKPTDARSALPAGWDNSGYVDENGMSVTVTRSTTAIHDWAKSVVRNLLTEYAGAVTVGFLQVDKFAAEAMFGAENVTITPADRTHGELMQIAIGAQLPPIKSYCFSMKDEDTRIRVYVPRGQFTDVNQVDFKPDAGNVIGGTLNTYDDGTGHSIYFMYDDGEVLSA